MSSVAVVVGTLRVNSSKKQIFHQKIPYSPPGEKVGCKKVSAREFCREINFLEVQANFH